MTTTRQKAGLVFTGLLAGAGFWAGNKIAWQVRTDMDAGHDLSSMLDRFWLDLSENPTHISTNQTDLLIGLAVVVLIGLIWAFNSLGKRPTRPGEEHGSARWATTKDMKPFRDKDPRNTLTFTQTEALSLDSRKTQRNLNALVIGGSGSGKSRYFVLPNLTQANTSFAVTDPKGELLSQTGDYLTEQGYRIKSLNVVDFARSDRFNPLHYFNPDQAEVDVQILVQNFMANTSGRQPQGGSADFFEKAERALLGALTAYVYFTRGPSGTLIDVVDLVGKMQASEEDESQRSEVDLIFESVNELIAEHDAEPEGWGQAAVAALDGLRFAAAQYNTYTQGAGETKKSVIISLGVRMAPLHMSQMRTLLSEDTVALDTIGSEKTALFLVIPDTHAAFNFIVAIFYEQLFETNIYIADHNESHQLDIPVQCFMDEFANIGKMPSFERKIAVMRSRGISVSVVMQNFAQGKALYKDDWETIVGNCDSFLFLGGSEKSTTEYVSKLLGKQTITSFDTSESKGRNASMSKQNRTLGRDLMTPDEIASLPGSEALYVLRGVRPFHSKKLKAPDLSGNYIYDPDALETALLEGTVIHWEPETRLSEAAAQLSEATA